MCECVSYCVCVVGCRGLHGGAGVNNRSASVSAAAHTHPSQTSNKHARPKNPIQLIRFFKTDQFLISGASDYGQYYCHGEDSCWTAVFIYRNVSFFGTLCRWGGGKGLSQAIAALQSLGCPHRVQPLHARLHQPYTIKAAGAVDNQLFVFIVFFLSECGPVQRDVCYIFTSRSEKPANELDVMLPSKFH